MRKALLLLPLLLGACTPAPEAPSAEHLTRLRLAAARPPVPPPGTLVVRAEQKCAIPTRAGSCG